MDARHHDEIDTCHADHARLAREVRGAWNRSQLTVDERIRLTTVLDTAARRLIDARYLARLGEPERAALMLAFARERLAAVDRRTGPGGGGPVTGYESEWAAEYVAYTETQAYEDAVHESYDRHRPLRAVRPAHLPFCTTRTWLSVGHAHPVRARTVRRGCLSSSWGDDHPSDPYPHHHHRRHSQ
jgi:hypothetical protein